ncbi:MAG: nucleoside deaminase [Pseudomonadota bacterium]|uniref:Nucleoside deaminase n=1 Tax=Candidatus Desulfatibia profunda TaxID=2841695 RepID=A0A8J6TME6_9BACT|nr:nucleoside deaminase [Candidatus Desulfatibia profunda]MBL7179618.1 nucleoside deaminase [Desulfobacterales bacterium]
MDYEYFMQQALDQARKALAAGEFPVGCVLVYQNRVLVSTSRTGTAGDVANEIDHAEMVALRRLIDLNAAIDKSKITLFCTMEPCMMCLGAIVLSGLGKVVYAYEDVMGGGTGCDLKKLTPLYRDQRISIVPNILRPQSLELFKTYFNNPQNAYWRQSLLARYTLGQ